MTRWLASFCMVAMLTVVSGCGSEAEDAVESTTTAFTELADRLARITTSQELAAAQPELKEIGAKISAAMERMKALDQLSDDDSNAIAEKLGPQMAAAQERAFAEVERIGNTIDPMAESRIETMLGID
jgi:hypothetical protein